MTVTETRPDAPGQRPDARPPTARSTPRARRRPGVRAEFALCALAIALVAAAGTVLAARATGASARQNAREDATEVARRTSASISVGIEAGVTQLSKLAQLSDLNQITSLAPGSDTDARCRSTFALLSSQGFSFVVTNEAGQSVCTGTAAGATDAEKAATGPVLEWLNSTKGWDQLGDVESGLVAGRMTMDPGGRTGNAAVAIPLERGAVAVWLAAWRAFVPPLDAAISTPGVESVVLIDNNGAVVVATPRLVDGQPPASRARPDDGSTPVAGRLGTSDVYQATVGLEPGTDSGIRPSTSQQGGVTTASIEGNWVTSPIPRLPVHVAVAYSEAQAAEVQNAALRNGLWVTLAVVLTSLAVLLLLARRIASPLKHLASAAHRARSGGEFDPPSSGPAEVRQLSAEVTDLVRIRSQVGDIASAARERERERLARLLNADVSQRLATAALLSDTDVRAAQDELAVAQERLAQVTAELDPPSLPAGGVGPALVAYAAGTAGSTSTLTVEDHTRGARLPAERERALYRTVLETARDSWDVGPTEVAVVLSPAREGISAEVTVPGSAPWAPHDDAGYFDQHEFTAAGGRVVRQGASPHRTVLLEA